MPFDRRVFTCGSPIATSTADIISGSIQPDRFGRSESDRRRAPSGVTSENLVNEAADLGGVPRRKCPQ